MCIETRPMPRASKRDEACVGGGVGEGVGWETEVITYTWTNVC